MGRTVGEHADAPARAPDPGRRRRAGRGLPADGLQRGQQPRAAARRHAQAGAARDLRPRLLAQPRGPQPAHPREPPGRPALHPGPGGHRQRADGPLRALAGRGLGGGGLPRPAVRGRRRGPGVGVRRPAARHRRRRVRGDRHVPRQPPGHLARGAPRAVRGVRAALGHPRRRPTRGSTSTEPPAPSWPPTHLADRGHTRIAWVGWRKDSWIGEDRRSGWSRAMRNRGLATTGLACRVEDSVASGREAAGRLLDDAAPTAFVCASDTLAMGVLHALDERGLRPGADIAVVGFDDSQVAQVVPGRADLGPPAARGGRRRGGQGAGRPARGAAGRRARRAAASHAGRARLVRALRVAERRTRGVAAQRSTAPVRDDVLGRSGSHASRPRGELRGTGGETPVTRRRSADDAKAEIREAALDLFLQQGYDAASLEEVAERVGVTRPAVLYHFGSKEALLLSVVEPGFDGARRRGLGLRGRRRRPGRPGDRAARPGGGAARAPATDRADLPLRQRLLRRGDRRARPAAQPAQRRSCWVARRRPPTRRPRSASSPRWPRSAGSSTPASPCRSTTVEDQEVLVARPAGAARTSCSRAPRRPLLR